MTDLWKKDLFINDNIFYLFNKPIYEYDMQEAGYNLIRAYQLLPQERIDWLSSLSKERRHIVIGKMYKENLAFKENHMNAFKEARKLFFESNDLETSDIISIKKDAIFTTKECKVTRFFEFINFRKKHEYTSYIRLGRKLEFYYSPDNIDIKGLSDKAIDAHSEYMIDFIKSFIDKMETTTRPAVLKYTRKFIDRYKRKELPIGYYRRFDTNSFYDTVNLDGMKLYECDNIDDVDISFNYFTILIKLIKIPL